MSTLGYVEAQGQDLAGLAGFGPNGSNGILPNLAGIVGNGIAAGVTSAAPAASTVANTASKTIFGIGIGDATLVAIGIILAIGALLISQKQTVVAVGKVASKVTG